ncbi:hypothetical protein AALA61_05480 [Oscillospiraceae bacterium 42-9]
MKKQTTALSRTLRPAARTEERLAAMARRRGQSSLRRFWESMSSGGFEFVDQRFAPAPRS